MGNFSQEPAEVLGSNLAQGYVGLHIEQGVPVLDRDINLLSDFISHMVRTVVQRYIGSGVLAGSNAFSIRSATETDFEIVGGGFCLVNGMEVGLSDPSRNYSEQDGVPAISLNQRNIAYLDVWLEEVDGTADTTLLNGDDVGMQTAVREALRWQVLVNVGAEELPTPEPGHHLFPLARLDFPGVGTDVIVTDLRRRLSPITDIEDRLSFLEEMVLRPVFAEPGSQVSPNFGTTGQSVQLFGRNFDGGDLQVLFGAQEAAVQSVSAIEIVVLVPSTLAVNTAVNITVRTSGGETISDDTFTRIEGGGSVPTFAAPGSQISPNFGTTGQTLRLFGSNFNDVESVAFIRGLTAPVVAVPTSTSNTEVRVTVPVGLNINAAYRISVTSPAGSDTSDDTFTPI